MVESVSIPMAGISVNAWTGGVAKYVKNRLVVKRSSVLTGEHVKISRSDFSAYVHMDTRESSANKDQRHVLQELQVSTSSLKELLI